MATDCFLVPTADSKTRFYLNQKNTYGLLPGPEGSCRGATTTEGGCWHCPEGKKLQTCYVANMMNLRPRIRAVLQHNLDVLLKAGTITAMRDIMIAEFQRFSD